VKPLLAFPFIRAQQLPAPDRPLTINCIGREPQMNFILRQADQWLTDHHLSNRSLRLPSRVSKDAVHRLGRNEAMRGSVGGSRQ
jgi:hypothetical protein